MAAAAADEDSDGPECQSDQDLSELSLYELLKVDEDVSAAALRRAYLREALKWHPDKCRLPGAEARFKRLSHAFNTLNDPSKRRAYDADLRRGPSSNFDGFGVPTRFGHGFGVDDDGMSAAEYAWWEEQMRDVREYNERAARQFEKSVRRERAFIVGTAAFVAWLAVLCGLASEWQPAWPPLSPRPLSLSNREFGSKHELRCDFKTFTARLVAERSKELDVFARALSPFLRMHTAYLRLAINDTDIERLPIGVSTKHGRRGILVSSPRKVGKKVLAFSPFAIQVEAKRRHLHFIAVDNTAIA